ncbi:hypothetical protein [Streptomyces sp. RerS4]|uniref:hypothetical protein n=1 Tax=Streptomyces sp. RerS4 TaxID=2942449 RepID=UPI00201C9032|nr:hypothetical protein [Streptomyces sp. RerS4]UQX02765.1 hypothetical protein M4D82_21435 [Streptomyces sp. RerS4]
MISEPELDGAWPPERPGERAWVDGADGDDGSDSSEGPLRAARRPWVWALGGAVVASAVWAGFLVAQDRFSDRPPPLAYRHSEDLCEGSPLPAVSALTGRFGTGRPRHAEDPRVDWSFCGLGTEITDAGFGYEARIQVELHKKVDPEPEFGAGPNGDPDAGAGFIEVQQVPGLGERALFDRNVMAPRLRVLDGGAVFTLTLREYRDGGEAPLDEDALTAAMIEDMRTLMRRLRG